MVLFNTHWRERDGILTRRRILQLTGGGMMLLGGSGIAAGGDEFIDIIGSDPSSYPRIELNVRVDTDAGRDGRLSKDDFTVVEDGEVRELTDFEFSSTELDLVFVFDDTGSMGGEIDGAKRQSKELTQQIADAGIDARYGLVSFKDDVEVDLSPTADAEALQSAIDDLSAEGGGDFEEDNFDALERALEFDLRGSALKVFIDITDALSHYKGDGSGVSEHTLSEVREDLLKNGITYVAVSPGFDDPKASKKVLAEEVGGLHVDIGGGDFDQILQHITKLVVESYILAYETSLSPGTSAPISVTVDDPDRGTGSTSAELRIPEDVGPGFEESRSEKLALAESVTDISASIDEQSRAIKTLNALSAAIDDDSVDVSTAVEVVERLKLGENVSESTLSVLGPDKLGSPEDVDTLVGAPSGAPAADGSFNLAGRSIKNAAELIIIALAGIKAIKTLAVSINRAGEAAIFAEDLVQFATSTLLGGFEEVVDPVNDFVTEALNAVLGDINDDGVKDGDQLAETVEDLFDSVADNLSNGLLSIFEQSIPGQPLDQQLSEFDATLGPDDGGVTVNGDRGDAEAAASAGIDKINEEVRDFRESARILDIGSELAILLGAVGSVLLFTGLGAPFGAFLTIMAVLFGFTFESAATIGAISRLAEVATIHDHTLDSVVAGTGGE